MDVATYVPAEVAGRADAPGFGTGVRAMAGWLPGMALYGLVVGVMAGRADVPALAGWLLGPAVFSGGAQVAALDLLGQGAAPAVVVLTVLAVNARLIVYSATLGSHWRTLPGRWRALAAYLLVDPSFAVGLDGYEHGDHRGAHAHYLGGAAALWATWLTASAVGVLAAGRLPVGLGLEFVMPLFLLGEAQRRLTSPTARVACAVAVGVALVGTSIPLRLGLLVAIGAGLAVAVARDGEGGR